MFKTVDIDVDYNKLLQAYNELGIDSLITKSSDLKQLAVQCRAVTKPEDQLYESCGSLLYNWSDYDSTGKLSLRKDKIVETDIVETCDLFKNTYIEEIIKKIKALGYNVYRGRFLLSLHKTCLTYHTDASPRLHIPIYTNNNCMMIVDDTVIRLPFGNTYIVDTRLPHTALNASKQSRVHLVFCVDKF